MGTERASERGGHNRHPMQVNLVPGLSRYKIARYICLTVSKNSLGRSLRLLHPYPVCDIQDNQALCRTLQPPRMVKQK
jgi:hypothetical protein